MANANASAVILYVYARFPAIFLAPIIPAKQALLRFLAQTVEAPRASNAIKSKTPPRHGKAHRVRVLLHSGGVFVLGLSPGVLRRSGLLLQ
jgi:hypothetical protein